MRVGLAAAMVFLAKGLLWLLIPAILAIRECSQ